MWRCKDNQGGTFNSLQEIASSVDICELDIREILLVNPGGIN